MSEAGHLEGYTAVPVEASFEGEVPGETTLPSASGSNPEPGFNPDVTSEHLVQQSAAGEHPCADWNEAQPESLDNAPPIPEEPPPPPPPGGRESAGPVDPLPSSVVASKTSPPLGAGVGASDIEDMYDKLQFDAILALHRDLLKEMRTKDPDRKGTFSITQVRELWRHLQDKVAEFTPPEPTFQQTLSKRISSNRKRIFGCFIAGILPFFFLLWAATALVHATLRSFAVRDSGALTETPLTTGPGDIWPIASANAIALHRLQEYSTMDLNTLRRMRDIVFMHNSVFYHFQVSSFIHRSGNDILFTAPDGATIHMFNGIVRFKRGFHSEELVDLSETERHVESLGEDEKIWTYGNRFSIEAEVL